jgi:hypothetical protein
MRVMEILNNLDPCRIMESYQAISKEVNNQHHTNINL